METHWLYYFKSATMIGSVTISLPVYINHLGNDVRTRQRLFADEIADAILVKKCHLLTIIKKKTASQPTPPNGFYVDLWRHINVLFLFSSSSSYCHYYYYYYYYYHHYYIPISQILKLVYACGHNSTFGSILQSLTIF